MNSTAPKPIDFSKGPDQAINQMLEEAELKLDEAGKTSATQAFNLGCTTGLIPAMLFIAITYLATKSWLAAVLMGILMVLALLGFANLAASMARTRTMQRIYNTEIATKIEQELTTQQISSEAFHKYAWDYLPGSSLIGQYLPQPPTTDPQPPTRKPLFRLKLRK